MNHPFTLPIKNPVMAKLVRGLTQVDQLKAIYDQWLALNQTTASPAKPPSSQYQAFLDYVLRSLNVTINCQNPENLASIPRQGPLIIVANHPLGGLEGMLLSQLLLTIRPDLKVLTNHLLLRLPELQQLFIGVDILNNHQTHANGQAIREMSRHLRQNGALLIFPAGTVAHPNWKKRQLEDAPWHHLVGHLARKFNAHCLPIYISGRNKASFYLAALVHPLLRTALLGRAMLSRSGQPVAVAIGQTIDNNELKHFTDADQVTEYLRLCCELLIEQQSHHSPTTSQPQDLRANLDPALIEQQLQRLKPYCLLEQSPFKLYCAPYDQLGCLMDQIAISREQTFRAVDEGTGKELDSDRFDRYYWHLWIWDDVAQQLVGGYRLGKTDEIVTQHGINKLYSSSLYHYDQDFIRRQGGTVEVGRSFIIPAYQGHPRVLDLLWRGIGKFMVDNPQYHTLFGCVSVSRQYSNLARAFLADTLLENFAADQVLRQNVSPVTPFAHRNKPWTTKNLAGLIDVPIINKLLGRIDNGKRIPILIRHYLALNGRFISFTLNQGFNDSLDGLLIVDLRQTPDKYINRYLGKEGAQQFTSRWKNYETAA